MMPDNEPNEEPIEEPDEELPFPDFDLSEIERLNPSMVQKTFNTLIRTISSKTIIIKHKDAKIKKLTQEYLVLNEEYKAFQDNILDKQTINTQTTILTAITSAVITIGGGFLFASQVVIGLLIIAIGLILAWITARSHQTSRNKQREDSK